MDAEYEALVSNDTFELTTLPPGRKAVGGRWVYSVKSTPTGDEQYKARYVARGFSQVANIDYHETFSPTARITSIRMLMQLAAQEDMIVHQMDVKSAYLNAPIDCEIYVSQPAGYEKFCDNGEKLYCKLNKSLYGLKQSGRNWNNLLDLYLQNSGFTQSDADPCVYTKFCDGYKIIVLIWVDDILIAASNELVLNEVKNVFQSRFKMRDLDLLSWFLGIEFKFEDNKIIMSQETYVKKILKQFNMENCKSRSTPCDIKQNIKQNEENIAVDAKLYRAIVGSLIYCMFITRPDLSFSVTMLSQSMANPKQVNLMNAKHVLRYLRGTTDYALIFSKSDNELKLTGFCDADWGMSEDRKSITGYVFMLSEFGPLISYKTKKQSSVALSSCEAEYMALTAATQEAKFLNQLLADMTGVKPPGPTTIFEDNQGAIALAKNPVQHQRSKHIDIKYHYIRQEIQNNSIVLKYIPSKDNFADVFTKPSSKVKLDRFIFLKS